MARHIHERDAGTGGQRRGGETEVDGEAAPLLFVEAVGVDVSPLVYIIMGPLLFLVMLIPFTINGLGVREAFFIAFLGRFGVDADAAFATGFLFYAVTVAASIPGGAIMIWDSLRPALMRPREQ